LIAVDGAPRSRAPEANPAAKLHRPRLSVTNL